MQGPPIDWDRPFGLAAQLVHTPTEASQLVEFDLHVPRGLGEPLSIYVSSGTPAEGRAVAFVYDAPEYGRVVVVEALPDFPPEDYAEEIKKAESFSREPAVQGTADVMTIRGDKPALVTTSEDGSKSTIFWLEGEIEIAVTGPNVDFDEVLAIAENF